MTTYFRWSTNGSLVSAARFSVATGPKWICGLQYLSAAKDCLIYSIGSEAEDGFERAVLKKFPHCEVRVTASWHNFPHSNQPHPIALHWCCAFATPLHTSHTTGPVYTRVANVCCMYLIHSVPTKLHTDSHIRSYCC
jgi:Methyltransferase domain